MPIHTKERVIVVDENDTEIGTKEREMLSYGDIYRISALWITNSESQILLAQRKWTKKNDPGKWGPAVAGTVNEGETYEDNIYKEAEEEIGLTGITFALGPKRFVDDGLHRFFAQWFIAQVDQPLDAFTPREEEVEQLAWVDKAVLLHELDAIPEKFVPNADSWKGLL